MAHPFVWYELMTSDLAAARAFYAAVVGWTPNRYPNGDLEYYLMMPPGETMPAVGMMTLPDEARQNGGAPGWIGYVGVPDVDAATDQARAGGARVHREPADIPDIGRFSVLADPHGAVFCLFAPRGGSQGPCEQKNAPGQVGWRELYAGDGPQAFDFYAAQFGWTVDHDMDMGPMGVYRIVAADGVPMGGIMTKPPQIPAPHWLYYFNVAGIDAALERVKNGGGRVLNGPMDVPGGSRIAQCVDPQGAAFALVAPAGQG
ncbi:glyoxalase [Alsobacter metallidurans]|uniref:Glyoxalase n=1 Tax=Alsobacter metallidurans TaxID=340221 RepID=A0A917IA41_9HYPH|nr:VOC family protein [Alsobacter metallidurans]GGH28055.1 glyoxalase [Alsobacter metallidurans]